MEKYIIKTALLLLSFCVDAQGFKSDHVRYADH